MAGFSICGDWLALIDGTLTATDCSSPVVVDGKPPVDSGDGTAFAGDESARVEVAFGALAGAEAEAVSEASNGGTMIVGLDVEGAAAIVEGISQEDELFWLGSEEELVLPIGESLRL